MSETYENDELFVYVNGDRWELGQVKCPNNTGDGYFCWYSTGDTAANTPVTHMHKLANAGWSHIERDSDKRIELDCKFGTLACEVVRNDDEYRELSINLYTDADVFRQVCVVGTNEYCECADDDKVHIYCYDGNDEDNPTCMLMDPDGEAYWYV